MTYYCQSFSPSHHNNMWLLSIPRISHDKLQRVKEAYDLCNNFNTNFNNNIVKNIYPEQLSIYHDFTFF